MEGSAGPADGISFFTIVAACNVLGIQFDLRGYAGAAIALWLFALVASNFLLYFSFAVLSFLNTASDANVVHGGWLIAIVGTQSLVLLGVRIADHATGYGTGITVLVHMLWGVGLALYAIFVTLFSYRIFFFKFSPQDLSPLLWVVMGAAAISANAGTSLILGGDAHMPFRHHEALHRRRHHDDLGLGDLWIPLLVCFGVWKHVICRVPLRSIRRCGAWCFRSACIRSRPTGFRWRPSFPSAERGARLRLDRGGGVAGDHVGDAGVQPARAQGA